MPTPLNILFIGDIVGKPGLNFTEKILKSYLEKYEISICIANGENLSDGKGIIESDADRLFSIGVNIITGGNHVWDRWQTRKLLSRSTQILRPLNYPRENPGLGYIILETRDKHKVAVVNLQGRTFMQPIDCPFKTSDWVIGRIKEQTRNIIVDFHAEASAEKLAMAWYLDGKISALIGTHTHTPTSDARVFPKGTAYITDVGMSGPYDSVIGMKKEIALKRFITQTPHKFDIASHDVRFCAVYLRIDSETGKALKIKQIIFPALD